MSPLADAVASFAADVGPAEAGAVVAAGSGSHADLGGAVDPAARPVRAPAGIVAHLPEEMVVRVRAGTAVADLDAELAETGQCVALPDHGRRTVGGVLAVGASGLRHLGWGPVRDTVLEARFVTAEGQVAVAGGPTVKNVAGYDLCRLLVGSLGTLGLLAEVVLRTRPIPPVERWWATAEDPRQVRSRLHRPTSMLWDGTTTWVLLDGHAADVEAQARAAALEAVGGPPQLPAHRWSLPAAEVFELDPAIGRFVAQVGVGVVHRDHPQPARTLSGAVDALHERIKANFDPTGRLAPGRAVGRR